METRSQPGRSNAPSNGSAQAQVGSIRRRSLCCHRLRGSSGGPSVHGGPRPFSLRGMLRPVLQRAARFCRPSGASAGGGRPQTNNKWHNLYD